ncbi:uncharacterized protein LOC114477418 isoform X2 [Gouania willdenowi]|uniref:uncharacterized protein LOC114477418 isoform X2 n=1 Tax=Gouania willdenowi TaxID=441366 RepID=UPI0010544048|nr:uncharacterized protein LOC114477418 isoform X2 [Gouania willdenowi]
MMMKNEEERESPQIKEEDEGLNLQIKEEDDLLVTEEYQVIIVKEEHEKPEPVHVALKQESELTPVNEEREKKTDSASTQKKKNKMRRKNKNNKSTSEREQESVSNVGFSTCDVCGEDFPQLYQTQKPYFCPTCEKISSEKEHDKGLTGDDDDAEENPRVCEICGDPDHGRGSQHWAGGHPHGF